MAESIVTRGCASLEEIKETCGYPSEERMQRGSVAVIECVQQIPCNPCEQACPYGAIHVGEPITSLPCLDENACIGCGKCVSRCPGLAIFLVNKNAAPGKATVTFPHEYLPLPEKGETVQAVNRMGDPVCLGQVQRINAAGANDGTTLVTLLIPIEYADEVRGMRYPDPDTREDDDTMVCRCEEITLGEIRAAIRMGADSVTSVKRMVRAGMGLCQGRTCSRLITQILTQELKQTPDTLVPDSSRAPVRAITFGELCGEEKDGGQDD